MVTHCAVWCSFCLAYRSWGRGRRCREIMKAFKKASFVLFGLVVVVVFNLLRLLLVIMLYFTYVILMVLAALAIFMESLEACLI